MSIEPNYQIKIPEGVQFSLERDTLVATGPAGKVERKFPTKRLKIVVEQNDIKIYAKRKGAEGRMIAGTFNSHIKNMLRGVQTPFVYKLKIAFTHFPMSVTVSDSELIVQNFLGEKKPRKTTLPVGAKVAVEGNIITVESPDIELAGRTATLIEQTTKIRARDRRIFQDGIYIIQKAK